MHDLLWLKGSFFFSLLGDILEQTMWRQDIMSQDPFQMKSCGIMMLAHLQANSTVSLEKESRITRPSFILFHKTCQKDYIRATISETENFRICYIYSGWGFIGSVRPLMSPPFLLSVSLFWADLGEFVIKDQNQSHKWFPLIFDEPWTPEPHMEELYWLRLIRQQSGCSGSRSWHQNSPLMSDFPPDSCPSVYFISWLEFLVFHASCYNVFQ